MRRRQVLLELKRKDGVRVQVKNSTVAATLQARELQAEVLTKELQAVVRESDEQKKTLDLLFDHWWFRLGAWLRIVRLDKEEKS